MIKYKHKYKSLERRDFMDDFFNSILKLQNKKTKQKSIKKDGSKGTRRSLICFHDFSLGWLKDFRI